MLAGCVAVPAHRVAPFAAWRYSADAQVATCASLYADLDDAINSAGVRDGQELLVPGYPFLRTNRLVAAALRRDVMSVPEVLTETRRLDRVARAAEIANLPAGQRQHLQQVHGLVPDRSLASEVARCGDLLASRVDAGSLPPLRVPDDYDTWKRVVGLYAVVRIPFGLGVRRYQRDTAEVFGQPLDELPVGGTLVRYAVQPVPEPGASLPASHGASQDALLTLDDLARRHAPILEVETTTDSDRPGMPVWRPDLAPGVDIARPTMFVRRSQSFLGGRLRTQLIYSVWFPTRPAAGWPDLLAGRLDGLVWRVTFGPDDRPLLFDSIHPCGCYHQFFPTASLSARPVPPGLAEWAFVPQTLPDLAFNDRVVLRVAASTHYIQRVRLERQPSDAIPIALRNDDDLRSLPLPGGGYRSLFGPDGIVRGTERAERWFFWPMGVRKAGAMRQWGRQATAFVGRRHFDDPELPDRYFRVKEVAED